MSIKSITTNDLRYMKDREGLILQGCGGNQQEWLDGINNLFTENGILMEGTKFQNISSFQYDGVTCLLYPMDDTVKLNIGKLSMWRLASHETFGGTWLSDFVPNMLGGYARDQPAQTQQKPDCPLIGKNGNIMNLIGIARNTLREHGMEEQGREMFERITQCQSYDAALSIIGEYVNITGEDEPEEVEDFDMGMDM